MVSLPSGTAHTWLADLNFVPTGLCASSALGWSASAHDLQLSGGSAQTEGEHRNKEGANGSPPTGSLSAIVSFNLRDNQADDSRDVWAGDTHDASADCSHDAVCVMNELVDQTPDISSGLAQSYKSKQTKHLTSNTLGLGHLMRELIGLWA